MLELHPEDRPHHLAQRVAELWADLRDEDPAVLAANTGATYQAVSQNKGEFRLPVWQEEIVLSYPDFSAQESQTGDALDRMTQALLAYYFHTADGTPESGRWISFSELPDGKFYTRAFQGYTGSKLTKTFANDVEAFTRAAQKLGGREVPLGDRAFSFQVLPRISLLAVCWLGDEDFPTSFRIHFDAAVSHYLSTDACAISGSILTRRLLTTKTMEDPSS